MDPCAGGQILRYAQNDRLSLLSWAMDPCAVGQILRYARFFAMLRMTGDYEWKERDVWTLWM